MDFKGYIAVFINEAMEIVFGQTMEGVAGFLGTPPSPEMGEFAFPSCAWARP